MKYTVVFETEDFEPNLVEWVEADNVQEAIAKACDSAEYWTNPTAVFAGHQFDLLSQLERPRCSHERCRTADVDVLLQDDPPFDLVCLDCGQTIKLKPDDKIKIRLRYEPPPPPKP